MALDADDVARLERIEADLASTDPDFARRVRAWRPGAEQRAPMPGWSVLPRWVLEVFLVAFACWVLPVPVSVVVVAVVAGFRLWGHAAGRVRPPQRKATRRGGRSR